MKTRYLVIGRTEQGDRYYAWHDTEEQATTDMKRLYFGSVWSGPMERVAFKD